MRNVKTATIYLLSIALLSASCGGCRQPKPAPAAAPPSGVAQVGSANIDPEDFRRLLAARSAGNPEAFATSDIREALLHELIVREAAYQKAISAGFDQRPEVQEAVKRLIADKFRAEQLAQLDPLESRQAADSRQIEGYYEKHRAEFTEPEAVRGAAIFVKIPPGADQERRGRFVAKAQSIFDQAKADPSAFADLAQRYSDDQSSRYKGGDTGWISSSRKPTDPVLATALLSLQDPGDFAPLVAVNNGVWITRVTEKRPAFTRSLAEVKDIIAYKLAKAAVERRQRDLEASLTSGLVITINRDLLNSILPPQPVSPTAPVALRSMAQAE